MLTKETVAAIKAVSLFDPELAVKLLATLTTKQPWPKAEPKAVAAKAIKVAKAPKAKATQPTLEQVTACLGKEVSFESGHFGRKGILEALVTGHYDINWADGARTYTFVPSLKGHTYLALKGEVKRFRIDKVWNLA